MNRKTRKALIKQQRELNRLTGLKSLEENNIAIAIARSEANQEQKQKKLNEEMKAEAAILETATEEEMKIIEDMRKDGFFTNSQIGRYIMSLRSTKKYHENLEKHKRKLGVTGGRKKTHRRKKTHKRRKTHRRS